MGFKSFVNAIRNTVFKTSDSIKVEDTELPDIYFEEKTASLTDISNEPILDKKKQKQRTITRDEPILDEARSQKKKTILESVIVSADHLIKINKDSTIPCPVCQTPIIFNVQSLMKGINFSCPKCLASVGLSIESKPIVEQAMEKLEKLKTNK